MQANNERTISEIWNQRLAEMGEGPMPELDIGEETPTKSVGMELLCPICCEPLLYFPDGKWICGNKNCKLYAPKTYYPDDLSIAKI